MLMQRAREAFAALAQRDDADIDLAEAALWIAAEDRRVDVPQRLAELEALAAEAAPLLEGADTETERVSRLNEFLFELKHFVGNHSSYYDPENSFLDQVLERRRGIPITLSVLYLEMARRLGVPAEGVGFPGHFLVRAGDPPLIVDPFHGRIVSRAECEELLQSALGDSASLDDEHMRPVGVRQILARILTNLKQVYLKNEDYEAALSCCERVLLLLPEAPSELRDRGLIYAKLECFGAALNDLERFLELSQDPRLRSTIEDMLDTLREQVQHIH